MTKKSVREIAEVSKIDHETILAYMGKGLQATYLGLKVYNTDIPNDRNADEDPLAPSMEKRREATRAFVINQIRKGRDKPYTQDVSEDPDGTHGISFTLPQNIKNREKIIEKINEFRIDENEFLRYHPSPTWPYPFPPEPIDRDPSAEKAIWEKHIAPIVKKYDLKDLSGRQFEYRFIEKEIDEKDLHKMVRKTTVRCFEIDFPKRDAFPLHENNYGYRHTDDGLSFFIEFVDRLNDPLNESSKFPLVAGGKVDLRKEFRNFLRSVFANDTLPEFLEVLRRDLPIAEADQGNPSIEDSGGLNVSVENLMSEVDRCYDVYKQLLKDDRLSHENWTKGIDAMRLTAVTSGDIAGVPLHYNLKNKKRNITTAIAQQTLKRIAPGNICTVAVIQKLRKGIL